MLLSDKIIRPLLSPIPRVLLNSLFDCAIIGGGPAGLNAALVLGRARRSTVLFDNDNARNAVTQESHGFITPDGIRPKEFREIAHKDITKYPSVIYKEEKVTSIIKKDQLFEIATDNKDLYQSKTIIISTGLRDVLPDIENISTYYGKSLFNCPYCDGWEMRDKPLAVIIEEQTQGFHFIQTVFNWSKDLIVCTNGKPVLNPEQKRLILNKGIKIFENKITKFEGENGQMEKIIFENGDSIIRKGGFVLPQPIQASDFAKKLGCEYNSLGGILVDFYGRTSVPGVYAAGDASVFAPAQLIIAAADGLKAAVGVNRDLIQKEFLD
ncbi:NAD(P)/FAD-dependent oxidoreductase [Candidatus Nitrosocosmicus agrestis]|uniref:NAD(P)/FAD-dependent oxidoreductase n=1 Tax=Candidatus Nitrosocosmicus agrestis TaxID=2563600 RepID=UPI00122DF506|nr:NAD(P)/FAD-dependent oxidoreductase [Candidatus Nitrosocosmicus sp. SS]KAA2282503.1 NAD(P)/FAD-dependent oxidoreductase [Candidatus Nitrosocosmicus sp. SS]KAF0868769.1 NAD(P)/FAD-dependent oxidoreductase [Candidatus Nitrosocosmicus sp. SS]